MWSFRTLLAVVVVTAVTVPMTWQAHAQQKSTSIPSVQSSADADPSKWRPVIIKKSDIPPPEVVGDSGPTRPISFEKRKGASFSDLLNWLLSAGNAAPSTPGLMKKFRIPADTVLKDRVVILDNGVKEGLVVYYRDGVDQVSVVCVLFAIEAAEHNTYYLSSPDGVLQRAVYKVKDRTIPSKELARMALRVGA
jgi:hypothetical protein